MESRYKKALEEILMNTFNKFRHKKRMYLATKL